MRRIVSTAGHPGKPITARKRGLAQVQIAQCTLSLKRSSSAGARRGYPRLIL